MGWPMHMFGDTVCGKQTSWEPKAGELITALFKHLDARFEPTFNELIEVWVFLVGSLARTCSNSASSKGQEIGSNASGVSGL